MRSSESEWFVICFNPDAGACERTLARADCGTSPSTTPNVCGKPTTCACSPPLGACSWASPPLGPGLTSSPRSSARRPMLPADQPGPPTTRKEQSPGPVESRPRAPRGAHRSSACRAALPLRGRGPTTSGGRILLSIGSSSYRFVPRSSMDSVQRLW